MTTRIPAEVFPPGDFLREEIESRGWTQGDLAKILGRDLRTVNEVVKGKRAITPDTAKRLSQAFGTSPEFWMALESVYQLSKIHNDEADEISRKARLYEKAPVREMIKRGWIEDSGNIDVLEKQVCTFLEIASIEEDFEFRAAARKSTSYEDVTPEETAWLQRARHLSKAVHAERFNKSQFNKSVRDITSLAFNAEDARRVPRFLSDLGVRLVVVEHLKGTKVDGACFWLDASTPVIVLSLRYDRIDWFWYTLGHELGHVFNGDTQTPLDSELDDRNRDKSSEEASADNFAAELLVDSEKLASFVARVRPLYSTKKVEGFAITSGIHPGIVVGQLHHRGEIPYSNLRKMLVPVRKIVVESAMTDGWGRLPAI